MPDHEETSFRRRFRPRRPASLALAAAGLLALGGTTGAVVMAQTRPTVAMAPATPTAIRALTTADVVTVRGRVAEVYGNKFLMEDGSGRALVDTGPEGDRRALVTAGAPVLVQGRFDRGFLHAAFLVGSDGKVVSLRPIDGPRHGPRDRGPGAPPPPGADGKAPPPPPPGADGAALPPPPVAAADARPDAVPAQPAR